MKGHIVQVCIKTFKYALRQLCMLLWNLHSNGIYNCCAIMNKSLTLCSSYGIDNSTYLYNEKKLKDISKIFS